MEKERIENPANPFGMDPKGRVLTGYATLQPGTEGNYLVSIHSARDGKRFGAITRTTKYPSREAAIAHINKAFRSQAARAKKLSVYRTPAPAVVTPAAEAAAKGERLKGRKPGRTAPARKPRTAKPRREDSSPPPRTYPRGFKSAESAAKVREAQRSIAAAYPSMSVDDIHDYLIEVGAGRYMALAAYSPKSKKAA